MKSHKVLIIILTLFLLIFSVLIFVQDVFDKDLLGVILILSSCLFIIPFVIKDDKNIKSYMFRPFVVFLMGYFVVFFQRYYDLYLGFISKNDSVFYEEKLILYSLLLSCIGLTTFLIGYYSTSYISPYSKKNYSVYYKTDYLKKIMLFSTFLVLIFVSKNVLSGNFNYTQEDLEKNAGGISNYSSILFVVVYFALLSLSVYNCKLLKQNRLKDFIDHFGTSSLLCLGVYVISLLLVGSRSNVIIISVSLLFAMLYVCNKRFGLFAVIIGVASFAYVMSVIGITRKFQGMSIAEKAKVAETISFEEKSIMPTTLELAGSLQTFNASLDYVPKSHDYMHGSFHVRNVVSAIPFSSRIFSYFFDSRKRYHSSDFFITYIIQGENYTYGNGTSINADLYLNYGPLGILIGMLILGVVFRKTELSVLSSVKPSLNFIVLFMFLMGYALPYSRNGILAPINYVMFTYILLYFYKKKFMRILNDDITK